MTRPTLRIFSAVVLATSVTASGVYGLPSLKLAICTINDAGSTAIFRLLHAAEGKKNFDTLVIDEHRAEVAFPSYYGSKLKELLADADWTKFVVLRDPVERFASAFLHKCVRSTKKVGCPETDVNRSADVLVVLTALESELSVNNIDAHFRPFSISCNLKTSLSSYKAILFDDLHAGLVTMLETIPRLADAKRKSLLSAVSVLFPHVASATKVDARAAPPGSSLALAQGWRDAANTIPIGSRPYPPDALILPRLKKLYSEDFELYDNFMKKRGQPNTS